MTKKLLSWLLIAALLLPCIPALAEDATEPTVYDHLTVGNTTRMQGNFFTELWGNATSDIDVRDLLHGYNLVRWDGENGMFATDASVVSGLTVLDSDEGDRSYVLVLYDDLYYSDGTQITAWDYAFSILFQIAPELTGVGGRPIRKEHLLGYEAYLSGEVSYLAGVQVIADDTLMITLDHNYLPFFYEMGLLSCNPYPIHVIAPGVTVKDDGSGVYLANADDTVMEPVFTAELLSRTVTDPETGYLSHPSVVSGPYTLTSWDGLTAEFAINTYYKGNVDGAKPTIPTLTYTLADNATMMEQLENGEFDLLDKVLNTDSIMAGMALAGGEDFAMSNYPRIGLSYISFACEKKTVADEAVRQAIAWCMDREQMVADYVGNFGLLVNGYYGIGQWMYGVVMGTTAPPIDPPENENDREAMAAYEEALAAWEALNLDGLTVYTADTVRAAEILDAAGWTLNPDGLRQKMVDGEVVTLELTMIYPEGNTMAASFETSLIPNLEQIGVRLTLEPVEMTELLRRYYKQGERDMDMIYLASNFDLVFDPSVNFQTGADGEPNWSYTNHSDDELYDLAVAMRKTEPGDVLGYVQQWIAFQERFNETLPMIPIYSNIYFDFYTSVLRNYQIAAAVTWGEAIVPAYMSDEPEEELEELDEEFDDEFEEFDD